MHPGGSSLRLAAGEDICPVPEGPLRVSCERGKVVVPVDIVQTGFEYSDFFLEVRIGGKFCDKG